jgi:mono/diheme cytochrome c family protein
MIDQYVSPAELRRLLSALSVVLGFIAIAAMFAFMIVPGQRYQANTADESAVVPVQGDSGWLDPTDYLPTKRIEIPPIDPATVMRPTPELLARGKALFVQNCVACHGAAGHGDGPGGRGLNPPPRNFTSPTGWQNGTRIEDIYRTLEEGIKGSAMVSYDFLPRRDRMALVHYVQSLGHFDHGQSDPAARAALEKVFSGSGEVIPNRIPVKSAIDHLIAEYRPVTGVDVCPRNAGPGRAVEDPRRAALTQDTFAGDSPADFARKASLGVPYNGLSPRVDTYGLDQWRQLRLCLMPR